MAVRVRKLARELGRSPAEVLGLLHVLGFTRYKSSEDMIADAVAGKARTAAHQGMRAKPIQPESVPRPSRASPRGETPDLMAALVPGVDPIGRSPRSVARKKRPEPPAASPLVSPAAETAEETAGDDAVARAVEELSRTEAALEQAEAELEAARVEIARLAARVAELEVAAPTHGVGVPLSDLLEQRGLRGRDEYARAVEGLAGSRRLDVGALGVSDPQQVTRLLDDALVLFGGDVPSGVAGVVGVSVSMDRADVPGASALARSVERIGEALLLNGWRQVRAVGVPPVWHGLLRTLLDGRIDLSLVPGGPRDGARAAADARGVDVVWLWAVEGDDEARAAWASAACVVDGPAALGGALEAMQMALAR